MQPVTQTVIGWEDEGEDGEEEGAGEDGREEEAAKAVEEVRRVKKRRRQQVKIEEWFIS